LAKPRCFATPKAGHRCSSIPLRHVLLLAKLKLHQEAVRGICEKHGVNYRWAPTDQPFDQVLLSFLAERGSK